MHISTLEIWWVTSSQTSSHSSSLSRLFQLVSVDINTIFTYDEEVKIWRTKKFWWESCYGEARCNGVCIALPTAPSYTRGSRGGLVDPTIRNDEVRQRYKTAGKSTSYYVRCLSLVYFLGTLTLYRILVGDCGRSNRKMQFFLQICHEILQNGDSCTAAVMAHVWHSSPQRSTSTGRRRSNLWPLSLLLLLSSSFLLLLLLLLLLLP